MNDSLMKPDNFLIYVYFKIHRCIFITICLFCFMSLSRRMLKNLNFDDIHITRLCTSNIEKKMDRMLAFKPDDLHQAVCLCFCKSPVNAKHALPAHPCKLFLVCIVHKSVSALLSRPPPSPSPPTPLISGSILDIHKAKKVDENASVFFSFT